MRRFIASKYSRESIGENDYGPVLEVQEVDEQGVMSVELIFFLKIHERSWTPSKVQEKMTKK